MTGLTKEFASVLETVRRPGDYHASGIFDLIPPGIEVEGLGSLALPVLPEQSARLIALAEPAPFGRGRETIVDTSVRRSWQIAANRVRFSGKRWAGELAAVVARAAEGLGVDDAVEAEFYKLLIYDTGGFFVGHRDTEKSPGMFATLVIALPSASSGGDLVVRHAGREVRIAMSGDDPGEARYAAFYADCIHEVLPVESGRRVTLVYNLKRPTGGKAPTPPRHDREEQKIASLLEGWKPEIVDPDDTHIAKIVYPLEHAYTPAELSFSALKGADSAAAGVLASAAARAHIDLHLALLTIEQTGSAEYGGGGRSGRGRWREPDADDFEMGEIFEHSEILTEWRRPDGAPCDFGELPVASDEFSPPDAIESMTPDENHFQEATGNEGATIERTYKRAAFVLWPRAGFLPMIAAAGLEVSLPYLREVVGRAQSSVGEERAKLSAEAHALAVAMIGRWPPSRYHPSTERPTSATSLLELLVSIRASDLIERFLGSEDAAAGRAKSDNPAVIEALSVLAPSERVNTIEKIIQHSAERDFAGGANLLARAAKAWAELDASELKAAAGRLMVHRPRDGAPAAHFRPTRAPFDVVVDVFRALVPIDPAMATRTLEAMLSEPKTYDKDEVLVPALLALTAEGDLSRSAAVARLRAACIAHLKARIALPLAPPADFRRDSALTCNCERCAPLARFLADPTQAKWTYRAAQFDRSHVETTIANSHCDVDTATETKGRPHTLIVTKNQASYEKLARQRRNDIATLEKIEGAPT